MKKEQILLTVCVLAAGVIAYSNLGLYEPVNASAIGDGKDIPSSVNVWYDPQAGLPVETGEGRSIIRQRRVSTRPELPVIAAPDPLPPVWVKLLPWPAPDAEHWASLRERYAVVAAAEETATDTGAEDAMDETGMGDDEPTAADPFAKKPRVDIEKVARLVLKAGTDKPVELVTDGANKGKPVWVILEQWPNVEFTVVELNKSPPHDPIGSYKVTAADIESAYATVHLEKTCINEYHEHRIRERVRDDDPGALRQLAQWVMTELKPRYGQAAVQLAIQTAEKARTIKVDMATVRELAALYRAAFDLEGELRILRDFLEDGNKNDPAVLEMVAEALDRAGAYGPARARWTQAAEIGSLTARLGLAENLYATGDLQAAADEFRKVQGSGDAADRAHAYEGEARVLVRQGKFKEALAAADRAVQSSAASWTALNTQGAARYYSGRYAEAEQAFQGAVNLAPPTQSRPRSNLGMALVAQGKLDAAAAAFQHCLDTDPLNWFDPVAGLGDVHQRRGRLTEANDWFETARVRDPKNPWILLRLGTAKLADGVEERALELARELVQAAPGCVDGLRLAGQAARGLDTPDWDESLRHLARAFQKEPTNVDLLRQYAAGLLGAGRANDALTLLAEATRTGTGFARRDGRTVALYAYTLFVLRYPIDEVREAIQNALRADIDDQAAEYVRAMLDTINEWDALRIWTDDFRRSRATLFGGWKEDDAHLNVGVSVFMNDNEDYAIFKGTASGAAEDRRATSFSRTENAKQVREWEAGIRLMSTDTEFVMHIYSGNLQIPGEAEKRRGRGGAELAFVVTRDDKIVLYSTAGTGRKENLSVIPIQDAEGNDVLFPRDGQFHTVRMVRTDHQAGKWQVFLDGEPLGTEQEIGQLAAIKNAELTLGFQADGDRGTIIEVHVDRVQITRTVD